MSGTNLVYAATRECAAHAAPRGSRANAPLGHVCARQGRLPRVLPYALPTPRPVLMGVSPYALPTPRPVLMGVLPFASLQRHDRYCSAGRPTHMCYAVSGTAGCIAL
eukprot:970114-Rhodomonas_salina.4